MCAAISTETYIQGGAVKDRVTILAYTFPKCGAEDAAFAKIAASLEQTWRYVGELRTVIVASHRFPAVETFVAAHNNVDLQVEPSLVYGNIKTMSVDCITKLHGRFSTPYVLIVQDDGYPVRSGLEEFVGKWDYIGAPIMCDGIVRKFFFSLGLGTYNGGFSLRSKRYCEYVSKWWFRFASKLIGCSSRHIGEDFVYCFLARLNPYAWLKFKMPPENIAFKFAYDALGGKVAKPIGLYPLGQHGSVNAEVTILAYHFWEPDGYDKAFGKIRHAIEETWRHCGHLKTILVVNEALPCVNAFATDNENVEIQVEPSLVPGDIHTMSVDCNSKLHTRFKTPYVLIVQSDGYPVRAGLRDFVGRYDFIGAPYVRDVWWKNLVCRWFNCWTQNGGFSLRSRRICEAAAKLWNEKYFTLGRCVNSSEDIFYTQFLPRHSRTYRKTFVLASNQESLQFSWDSIVPIPPPSNPFGFHGKKRPDG